MHHALPQHTLPSTVSKAGDRLQSTFLSIRMTPLPHHTLRLPVLNARFLIPPHPGNKIPGLHSWVSTLQSPCEFE